MNRAAPASPGSRTAPGGSSSPVPLPASLAGSVTEAGMFATGQCQKPEPVGASGSYTVTA